jgi:hypothetical protein
MRLIRLTVLFVLLTNLLMAQSTPPPAFTPQTNAYIGIVHPIVIFNSSGSQFNFTDYYQMGMTMAAILRKHPKYAWNLELVGFIRSEKGVSKTNNLMLHPGVSFFLPQNFAITPRFGFESSGRYGPSLIIGKKMFQIKNHVCTFNWVNLLRFGNDLPTTYTVAVNLTFGF